ncbi:hypothetical protein Tco_1324069, partial [Tanacetum coccineum]
MSPRNKDHYQSKKEAIHLLLTVIGDEIYSTVDACKTAHDMWIAIKRVQQGESLNIQDVKNNLFWEFGKFTSHYGESMESYYSSFYKMMNEVIRNNLTVATMQYQKKVNEIRAERIAKNANPLALVDAAQQYSDPYYQAPKSHESYAPLFSDELQPTAAAPHPISTATISVRPPLRYTLAAIPHATSTTDPSTPSSPHHHLHLHLDTNITPVTPLSLHHRHSHATTTSPP